ncbi:MAG: Na(+)/H(+) antiporter subunit D [Acidaminococcaceae bacterium]|nr:Na(+)/H(+) antiporter subunit D [Acidaminococcaceae bacterium]
MSDIFHPGIILILAGLAALTAPRKLRGLLLVAGPLLALYKAYTLPLGFAYSFDFVGQQMTPIYVDKLSWIFTFIFSVLACVCGLYAAHNESRMEALCALAYAGGAISVCLAKDWLSFIFFWESIALSSLFLVWCRRTPESRRAGLRYILVHMLGGNILLFGIFLKLHEGSSTITALTGGAHDLAFWAILVGVCVNVAMPPVNGWLVDAYSNSTITGGVFMSCLTTKVAVYALLRIFPGYDLMMWGGVLMALYGACYAIMENDMRRLLAHHIISQTGFMVAGVGIGTGLSMNGATAHAFCDILFKSLLFMCAGAVIYVTGIREINKLGNLAKRMPLVCICFFAAAFSISGIPLFNGFVSKAITVNAAAAAGHGVVYTLLELASIGTFLSIPLKMGYFIFLRGEDKGSELKTPLPWNMEAAMCVSAFLCFLYGVQPGLLYQYLPFAAPEYKPFLPEHVLTYVQMLGAAMLPFMMYLKKMEPHTAISLDTDWLYRKPLALVIRECSFVFCALCSALGSVWGGIYESFTSLTSNPMDFLDAKPFRKRTHYNPDNYRTSIADPMMIMLTVLVSTIGYFLARL